MSDIYGQCAATPAATLEQHITDANVAKNEAEWWAHHEIARLRALLAEEEGVTRVWRRRCAEAEAALPRAWEAGRDAAVTALQDDGWLCDAAPSIAALRPPPDLAQQLSKESRE